LSARGSCSFVLVDAIERSIVCVPERRTTAAFWQGRGTDRDDGRIVERVAMTPVGTWVAGTRRGTTGFRVASYGVERMEGEAKGKT
jgi:hypothetical protein